MINKKTDSPHIENFDLVTIKSDWIVGAVEIVRYALDYYLDENKCKYHYCHPNKSLKGYIKSYNENPKKFREDRKPDGMKPEHTIEQWCQICWERLKKEQVGIFKRFLKMYEKI